MRANYTDKGNPVTGTLTGAYLLTLRHPKMEAEDSDLSNNVATRHIDGTDLTFIGNVQDGSHIGFKNIDLTGIKQIHFKVSARVTGSIIEIRAGSPKGTLLGKAEVPQVEKMRDPIKLTTAQISNHDEQQDLFFVFRNNDGKKENILFLDWMYFDNGKMTVPNL